MTYVDEIVDWGEVARAKGLRWTLWAHLIADTHVELVAMATKLRLKSEWIQKPGTPDEHFDLIPSKRIMAIKYGAIPVSHIDLGQIWIDINERGSYYG
jgi:hypothetical protein